MYDNDLAVIINIIKADVKLNKYYLLYDNCLFKRFNKNDDNWKVCVPQNLVKEL